MREMTFWNIIVWVAVGLALVGSGAHTGLLIVIAALALATYHKAVAILESLHPLEQGQASLHTRLP